MTAAAPIVIDEHTRAGHKRFKENIRFETDYGVKSWDQWMEWQATRDPIGENPREADRVRAEIEEQRRGPGVSRRRPARKTTTTTTTALAAVKDDQTT